MSLGDAWDWVVEHSIPNPSVVIAQKSAEIGLNTEAGQIAAVGIDQAVQVAQATVELTTPLNEATAMGNLGLNVTQHGWDFGSWAIPGAWGMLTNVKFWIVVLILLALALLMPLVKATYRVVSAPAHWVRGAKRIKRRGVTGNVKATAKWWEKPATQQARRRRFAAEHTRAARTQQYGQFATIVHRTPAPPMEPRTVTIRSNDPAAVKRLIKRELNGPGFQWRLVEEKSAGVATHYTYKRAKLDRKQRKYAA